MNHTEINKRWRLKNRLAFAAHWTVQEAIRRGRLIKQPCEKCGNAKVHAHHDDYLKPLEVRWLCSLHHREHHTLEKGLTVGGKKSAYKSSRKPIRWPNRILSMPSPQRDKFFGEATRLRESGLSYKKIAKTLDQPVSQIYKWLNNPVYG